MSKDAQKLKFARVIKETDPIAKHMRGARPSVTNQSEVWAEYMNYLDARERKEGSLANAFGIAVDMRSPEVEAELRATAERMGEEMIKNPVMTFVLRLRKVLRERQAKNEALKDVRVQVRGSEVALVAGK